MDAATLQQVISAVGFPIVMCIMLCYYIFKVQAELTKAITELTQMVKELNTRLSEGGRSE